MKNRVVKYFLGKAFETPIMIVGHVFIVVGIFLFLENPLISTGLILSGLILSFSTVGIEFDREKKLFREFTSYVGIKKGKWNPLDEFPFVAVLTTRQTSGFISRGNAALTTREKFYDVYLLNETHRKRMLVKRLRSLEKAKNAAEDIAEILEKEFTTYKPVVSERTRERINRERRR